MRSSSEFTGLVTFLRNHRGACGLFLSACLSLAFAPLNGQDVSNNNLIDEYVKSIGNTSKIVFDAANIKQFWTDTSVLSSGDHFVIGLQEHDNAFESVPLRIKLVNVNEAQSCKIEIISETEDYVFSVAAPDSKAISKSSKENDFIQFHVSALTFPLEETKDFTFDLVFNSSSSTEVSIRKIILTFSPNKESSFLSSPGHFVLSKDLAIFYFSDYSFTSENTLKMKGKRSSLFIKKNFLISSNPVNISVKIKNEGKKAINLSLGFDLYTIQHNKLESRHFPYRSNNKCLKVISSENNSNKIIVDAITEWRIGCSIAPNAREDSSDIPNTSVLDATIVDYKGIENGLFEITLDKNLSQGLEKGTFIRIHGFPGGHFYTKTATVNPGEEVSLASSTKLNDNNHFFTAEEFPQKTYYVNPLLLVHTANQDEESTVIITDFSIDY